LVASGKAERPQGKDAIDYEGNPLRQSFGMIHKAFALKGES
jgi:hypothetical protein